MRNERTTRRLAAGVVLVALAAVPAIPRTAAGQTPFTAVGLGYPTPPVDARAAALGGVGVGLLDGSLTLRNPADIVEFDRPTLGVSASPEGVTVRDPGREAAADRSRFSVFRAVVPLGSWAASVGFGSVLDQDWALRRTDTISLTTGDFPFEELRENDGGVSSVDLSVARRIGPVSIGVSGQRLTGNLRQVLDRRFEMSLDSAVAAPERVEQEAFWSWEGWRVTAGAGVEIGDRIRVSGSYGWSTELEATRDSTGETRSFDMPSRLAVGASARASDDWLLTVGGGWASWSVADDDLDEEGARDVTWGGGGVEFRGWSLGPIPLSLRAGGRYAELPFHLPGREAATERALTFGLGSAFASGRAVVDLGLEIGTRGEVASTGTEESFTRLTLTATVHQ